MGWGMKTRGVVSRSQQLSFGVSPCSGYATGPPSPPCVLRAATTGVPRFAPRRATAAPGLRLSATPARRPRLRLAGTTGLRYALHGRQRRNESL